MVKLTDFLFSAKIPRFGIDIGGTLVKLVYFEYHNCSNNNCIKYVDGNNFISAVRDFIKSTHQYGKTGERDARLEMKDMRIGNLKGNLHFIRFPTSRMDTFLKLAEEMRADIVLQKTMYATGGGAYKFESDFKEVDT